MSGGRLANPAGAPRPAHHPRPDRPAPALDAIKPAWDRSPGAGYGWAAAALIAGAGVVYALVSLFALKRFPFSGDEYSYLLQAELFARGALKAPAPPFADWTALDHVVIDQFIRSKYPPGTSALLALGVRAHGAWLTTPLEAVLALLAIWSAAKLTLGARRAFLAVAFVAAAPLFIYESASYLSHTATLLWSGVAVLALVRWSATRRRGYLAIFGACAGLLFLTRPLDGLLVGGALLPLGEVAAVLMAGVCALPFVAAGFWYNALQFGSPFTDGYHAYAPALLAAYGSEGSANVDLLNLVRPEQIWGHLAVVETLLAQWTVPGAGLLACLGWVALRRDREAENPQAELVGRYLSWLVILFLGALVFTLAVPDDAPRPRYLSVLLLPLAFFAAAGWDSAANFVRAQLGRRASRIIGMAMWLAPLFLTGAYLEWRVPQVVARAGLGEELERQHITSGVVIVRAEWPTRYARNGPFFDHPPLLLSVGSNVTSDAVAARFPGEAIYEALEPIGNNPWKHGWIVRRVR